MTYELGRGGGGKPIRKKNIPFPESQNGFFLTLVFFWVIILILYLKSKDSATHIIMFLLKHR